MIKIGITGSIASGKTFLVSLLKNKNLKVFEADLVAKDLLNSTLIRKEICSKLKELDFDFTKNQLRELVFNDYNKFLILEEILQPKIYNKCLSFIKKNKNEKIIFIEAPLLYELKYDKLCDEIIVICAEVKSRLEKALLRESMNESRFNFLNNKQLSDDQKINRADYVIYNNFSADKIKTDLEKILEKIV